MVFFGFVQVGMLEVAKNLGLPPNYVFLLLLASLLGSYINLPVTKIKNKGIAERSRLFHLMSWRFNTPSDFQQRYTVLAVNLGGAVFPVLFCFYLLLLYPQYILQALMATAILALIVNSMAKPAPGVGIVLPLFIPPVLAALLAVIIAPNNSPVVAYIAGTIGTLVGADLMNLKNLSRTGAEIASIGGAGTFDGIFLTGILSVLLSSTG